VGSAPRDRESVGDDLEVIDDDLDGVELVTDEEVPTARRPVPEAGDDELVEQEGPVAPQVEGRSQRRRRLLVLVIAAAVVAIAGVTVVVSRDDGDASNASRSAPDLGLGSTTIPQGEQPPVTTPGDASTTAPLLPEGSPSTPHVGELVASVTDFDSGDTYNLYADGRLIWRVGQPGIGERGFVEQRLTPQGIERVRSEFLAGLVDTPGSVEDCGMGACVRRDDGRFLVTGPESAAIAATRLVSYLRTLDESLPETGWANPRITSYVPARVAICLQTFVNDPDRVVSVPLDLSVVVPALPPRGAELLGGRAPIGGRPDTPFACFEVTLDEARTLADEFLGPAGRGSHLYSGIVISNPQLDAIQPHSREGIVAYIRFNALLPHPGSAAAFGG
jgi:hypothetical protein